MITFKKYVIEAVLPQKTTTPTPGNGGTLKGPMPGGTNNNWGGALPKLISLLPPGSWFAGSQKRSKRNTKSGGVSDHYTGNSNAYACDFGLSSTFNGNTAAATKFAIEVANRAGQNINSWQPYVGRHLTFNTNDGYRVQIIWQSNVGGNHYDHVHLGVRAGAGANQSFNAPPQDETNSGTENQPPQGDNTQGADQNTAPINPFDKVAAGRAAMQEVKNLWDKLGQNT